jgi:hypothetical protein
MTAGLLGNFDGLADNDFIAPNGTNLGSNLNDSEIHQFGLLCNFNIIFDLQLY